MSQTAQLTEQAVLPIDGVDSGYEEITSEEVDKVVESLESLMSRVQSENIRSILDEAADEIYALVYSEEGAEAEAA